MSERERPRIAVLGSINLDLVIQCAHLPMPGETVIAESSREVSGGKGANQAVAAARLGADVAMIGRVGRDDAATTLLKNLQAEGINTEHVSCPGSDAEKSEISSGIAVVMVERSGENSIVVVPGANGIVSVEDIDRAAATIQQSDVLLVQLEIPVETVMYACRMARQAGVRIILDPAPAPGNVPEHFFDVDLICPNQSEAASLLDQSVSSIAEAKAASDALIRKGAQNVIVTMGKQGAVLNDGTDITVVPPCVVEAVDSTAAGDAFAGALAVYWSELSSLVDATRFACAAGALAASKPGAQPGMPSRSEVEQLMNQSG